MTSPYRQYPGGENIPIDYSQQPEIKYYPQQTGHDFYGQQSGNNAYRQQHVNEFYPQQPVKDPHRNQYEIDSYSQQPGNSTYSQKVGSNFYSKLPGNKFYPQQPGNNFYPQSPENNFYPQQPGKKIYPQEPGNNFDEYVPPESKDVKIKNRVDDLATLEVLDEPNVLNELRTRYTEGHFYTYIGDILVAINPCQPVNLYGDEVHEKYKNLYERQKQEPHIYWIADELYRNLKDSGDDQGVIVSGESGAGKTESIKHILNHLIRLGPNNAHDLVQQLDQVNPLLELFGNASTPLNKNSSRFCKFIELQYTEEGQLQSGQIQYFIFEKSRLIQRHRNEKNFHIFYALLGWVSNTVKSQFYLGDSVADYEILVGDDMESVYNGQEDYREFQKKFDDLEYSLEKIGFKEEEIINIYKILSAILNLTNITFEKHLGIDNLDIADLSLVRIVAELLETDEKMLREGLLKTKLNVDDIQTHKTLAEADEGRDALAKELYNHLFSCIIDKINNKLNERYSKGSGVQMKKLRTINLLDISGFEKLNINGFEQLLINTANEVLHQIFLKHVMKREQEEYEKEGVKWAQIPFKDNADVIDLITSSQKGSQISIFHILEDEASLLPSTDTTLVQKLNKHFHDNPYYVPNNTSETEFGIVHYADTVTYSAVGFIEKTKDTLSRCLKNVILKSKNPLFQSSTNCGNLSRMGVNRNSKRNKDQRKRTEAVTNHFKTSLRQLKTKLTQSNLMFVRCLKPNTHLKPNKFDQRCVGIQLKACGLAEAANIRRDGYPVRLDFVSFVNRYEIISGNLDKSSLSDIQKCQHILDMAEVDKYYIGKTKVLLNYQEKEKLEFRKQCGGLTSGCTSARSSFSNNSQYQGPGLYVKKNYGPSNRKSSIGPEIPQPIVTPEEDIPDKPDHPFSQMDQSKIPAYDSFRETERDIDDNNGFFTKILKICRFLFYLFIIGGIISSTVSNRIGLFLLAGARDKKEEHAKLFISLGLPMIFSWIFNAIRCAFRGNTKPSWKEYLFIGMLDILRTIANCALVFLILPTLGLFRGLVLLYGYGQVPSLLLFLETIFGVRDQTRQSLRKAIYFFVFILQVGLIPAYITTDFLIWTEKGARSHDDRLGGYCYTLPLIVITISLSLWENYALFDIEIAGKQIPLTRWRRRMMKVRESTNFYIEPIKIAVFWVVSWRISDYDLVACWERYKDTIGEPMDHLHHFGIMYLEIVSAVLCSYLSGLACKLHMQKFSFAVPLISAPFITIVLSFLLCEYDWIPTTTFTVTLRCCKLDFTDELISPIVIMAISWLTTLVITSHIWKPKSERMALISKLFVPLFDPLLLDFSLLLRRRQDHKECPKDLDEDGEDNKNIPTLIVCATMWHETRQEMLQLLKSLFRLDLYQSLSNIQSGVTKRLQAKEKYNKNLRKEIDKYNLEIHIIFDDSWERDDATTQEIPNSFVKLFISLIPEAVMSVAKGYVQLEPMTKVTTPYGGRLELIMPGGNILTIHLKNKDKIRHRKRWSQVMYFYYLLGFKLFGERGSMVNLLENKVTSTKVRRNVSILNHLPEDDYKKIEKTFLLTLDGDVDFKPDSVKLLMDRMLKNKKVGAVCGRIHPIGSGPMIWYQQFEYAVGHWLQKAAEHVFGCVLCCPGCFSLFRASAVMDDNVMRAYTRKPIVARDFIQYEQGEDRWLCTLLLQQGYKIDYCAGADAYTFAPESFHDFYIQRRRWAPSTIANIMDLLSTWHTTISLNDNISIFFMFYQFILMTSSILAPATVVLMITGSYNAVLKLSMWESFVLSLSPVVLYIIVCFKTKTSTQINVAAFMTTIYSVVMVIVTVGTIINILQDDWVTPNVIFLVGLSIVFCTCGILHPQEMICLVHGILYFLTVPSSFIFLTVYFLCNLNIVSWGTREVPKKLSPEEEEEAKRLEEEKQKKKKERRFINRIGLLPLIEDIKKMIFDLLGKQPPTATNAQPAGDVENQDPSKKFIKPMIRIEPKAKIKPKLDPYYWTTLSCYGNGTAKFITPNEEAFWNYLIQKYLHPLKENKEEKEKIKEDLEMTRNNVVFGYFLLNLLWSVAVMQLQTMKDEMLPFFIVGKYEPVSVMFLAIFGIVLFLQFIGMCMHRWGTFLHLMSTTHLLSNASELKHRAETHILKMASASKNIDIEAGYSSSENYSDLEDLPPKDYDMDEKPTMNLYERNYSNRMEYYKKISTVRQRNKKTLKPRGHHNAIFHI